jgi:hypothetical protein
MLENIAMGLPKYKVDSKKTAEKSGMFITVSPTPDVKGAARKIFVSKEAVQYLGIDLNGEAPALIGIAHNNVSNLLYLLNASKATQAMPMRLTKASTFSNVHVFEYIKENYLTEEDRAKNEEFDLELTPVENETLPILLVNDSRLVENVLEKLEQQTQLLQDAEHIEAVEEAHEEAVVENVEMSTVYDHTPEEDEIEVVGGEDLLNENVIDEEDDDEDSLSNENGF